MKMPRSILTKKWYHSFSFKKLQHPLDNILERAPLLESRCNRPLQMDFNDQLNALTLSVGLSWREVALLRAYLAAAFQMRLGPARPAVRRFLLLYPQLGRILVDLFHERLDPDRKTSPDRVAELTGAYVERLAAIDNIACQRDVCSAS